MSILLYYDAGIMQIIGILVGVFVGIWVVAFVWQMIRAVFNF